MLGAGEGELVVSGVDASHGALARRFGLGFLSRRLPRRSGDFVPWEDVNLIALRLSRLNFVESFAELAELHPADIADIISQVGPRERAAVLAALNTGLAADTLQEMERGAAHGGAAGDAARARRRGARADRDGRGGGHPRRAAGRRWRRSCSRACPDEREEDLRELASHPEHTAGSLMTHRLRHAAAWARPPARRSPGSAASAPSSTR